MTFILVILSSFFTGISNLFVRHSMDVVRGTGDPFLIQRLLASGAMILSISFLSKGTFVFDSTMALLGIVGGLVLGTMMWFGSHAVRKGPPALSNAVISSACIVPPLLMAIFFGEEFEHHYSVANGIGATVVLAGLFWMSWPRENHQLQPSWSFFAGMTFLLHALYLTFFQWRVLLFQDDIPESVLIPFKVDESCSDCFFLFMFMMAAAIQWLLPTKKVQTVSIKNVLIWGGLGGCINGIGALLMLHSTEIAATSVEKALIFPLYCVCLICICNLWGRLVYKEEIHWVANGLCLTGIIISLI